MRYLLAILLSVVSIAASAQRYTISGYITDAASGEPLIGVAVIDRGSSLGTVTGNTGFYSISLPAGPHDFVFTALGYEEQTRKVELSSDITVNIALSISADLLSGAVVTAGRNETGVKGTQMSAIEVPVSQIKAIPAIGGEVDVIKALQLLPGVQSGTEGTAGIYVRGGGADENLLLMDGVPLYNVNHLFGFFSVFNADAIKNVTLYKGSFPARFGGHLSSVIDVRLNDGNDSEYHGNASIGLISSKFNFEGPIVKGRTTFNISARRTYLDLLAKPMIALSNRESYISPDIYNKVGGGYDFYDFNAKVTHRFNNNDRLSLSFYSGDDKAYVEAESAYKGDTSKGWEKEEIGWSWGNLVSALRWSHAITPQLYMVAGASYTRYRSLLGLSMDSEYTINDDEGVHQVTDRTTGGISYDSLIGDISATADFDWHPQPQHDVKFGIGYTYHSFRPGIISMSEKSRTDTEIGNYSYEKQFGDVPINPHETSVYLEDNYTVTPWLKANVGVHASMYNVSGKTYLSAEPRLSARALITDAVSLKASYSEMSQYIHLLCNSNLSLPSDLWVPVTENIKPMRSRQSALGVFYNMGKVEFSVEGYYKAMDNVLEYRDGASYLGTSTGWERKVCMGSGRSYGVEFFAQKKAGRTTGWIGYTLAKATRQFDRPGNIINEGRVFPARYDRRHDLSMTVTHSFSKRFDMSATFVYMSGNCGSLGFDDYAVEEFDGSGADAGFHYHYDSANYLPNRNNYRMPAYHRMDIGMNFYRPHSNGSTGVWNLSVYNFYNRLNPFIVSVGAHDEFDDEGNWSSYPVLLQISIFPIIPSLSYTYKF